MVYVDEGFCKVMNRPHDMQDWELRMSKLLIQKYHCKHCGKVIKSKIVKDGK